MIPFIAKHKESDNLFINVLDSYDEVIGDTVVHKCLISKSTGLDIITIEKLTDDFTFWRLL